MQAARQTSSLASQSVLSSHSSYDPVADKAQAIVRDVLSFRNEIETLLAMEAVRQPDIAKLKYLVELLHETEDPVLVDKVSMLLAPYMAQLERLPPLVGLFEGTLEKEEAHRQITLLRAAGRDALASFVFFDKYKHLVRKEWALLETIASDADLRHMRFAFVGCGAMPMTALGMADNFGVSVDCYDVDPQACVYARELTSLAGLEDKVRILHQNGIGIDYSPYDVVLVANLVKPRMCALAAVAKYRNVKAIITRRANGLVSLMYSSLDPDQLSGMGLRYAANASKNDKTSVHQSILLVPALV